MYVCMYICIYVYVCIYIYTHIKDLMHSYPKLVTVKLLGLPPALSIYLSIYIYLSLSLYMYRERDVYIYIYIYKETYYVCMYIYIYIHMFISQTPVSLVVRKGCYGLRLTIRRQFVSVAGQSAETCSCCKRSLTRHLGYVRARVGTCTH